MASAAALLHAIFITPPTWVLFRVMTGFCLAGLLVVSESWLNDASTNQNRGSMLSVYMVASLGATALGQLLLNAAPIDGMELFVLVSLSLVPIALMTSRSIPALQPTARMKIRALFKRSPMGAVGCFATGLINGAFWGMGAVYAHTAGLDPRTISVFMAIVVLGGIMSQWPLGRLSDRIDRRVVLAGLAAAIAVASFGIARFGGVSHELMFGLGWLFGAAAFPLYAISIAHVNDVLSSEDFVPASSALLLLYALGAVFGPFVGGAAIETFGAPGLFYYNAAVSCALFAFTLKRLYFGHAIEVENKEDFISMPRTTTQVFEMAVQVAEEANQTDDEPAQKP